MIAEHLVRDVEELCSELIRHREEIDRLRADNDRLRRALRVCVENLVRAAHHAEITANSWPQN